jgi:nitrate/TMAO reductase-like tetraheme cytochrome c subunit
MMGRRFPDYFYNWVSTVGAFLATGTFCVIVMLIAIDLFVHETTLYLGLLTYMILPGFVAAGLVLIAVGAVLEKRRRDQGRGASMTPVLHLDLRVPQQRRAVFVFVGGTSIFLMASSLGTYKAYQISESTKFCGTLCHSVMEPEHTAHARSAHARVDCVACHIGPGADWFVKSKMTGAYQVYSTAFKKYARPIETPIKNLASRSRNLSPMPLAGKVLRRTQTCESPLLGTKKIPLTPSLLGGRGRRGGGRRERPWNPLAYGH